MLLSSVLKLDQNVDVNSPVSLMTIMFLSAMSVSILFSAPVMIGAMVELRGYSEAQAGMVISTELFGMFLAYFPALYWMTRVNWRRALLVSFICMVLGNLASAIVYDPNLLLVDRIGVAAGAGLNTGNIGKLLAYAAVFGIAGAACAAILSAKLGRVLPIAIGMSLSIIFMVVLKSNFDVQLYAVSVCIFSFAFNFILPYYMAAISDVDTTGHSIMATFIASSLGLAGGSAIAAILQHELGFDWVILTGIILSFISLFLI